MWLKSLKRVWLLKKIAFKNHHHNSSHLLSKSISEKSAHEFPIFHEIRMYTFEATTPSISWSQARMMPLPIWAAIRMAVDCTWSFSTQYAIIVHKRQLADPLDVKSYTSCAKISLKLESVAFRVTRTIFVCFLFTKSSVSFQN